MKQKYVLLSGFALVTILLFVSCQSETKPTVTASSVEPATGIVAPQPLLEITTPSSLSMTAVPGGTETASVSVLDLSGSPTTIPESPMPLPALTPSTATTTTLTPLPTLDADDLKTAVAELLANPMDCDMPCWWGAIPGTTSINEIKHTISPYNFHISEYEEQGEIVFLLLETGYIEEQDQFEIGIVYNFSNSILTGITAFSPSVSDFLAKYGPPYEVLLETMSVERETLPVRLNMVYLGKGMAVGYVVDGNIQGDRVIGCFADEEIGTLRLITPDSVTSYKDFSPIFEQDRRYLPLEQATDLTMDEFMERFSDPTQSQCIETPIELWE